MPADRHAWALGPAAELKLDPVPHVGYQGQLRARPGCSWWPLPGGPGGLSVLVLSPTAAVSDSSSSAPPPPTPRSWPCTLCLELSQRRGQEPGIYTLRHGPQALRMCLRSLSGQHLASLDLSPSGSLAPPLPAPIRFFLAGRQGLHLTPSKPVSLIANSNQQGPHLVATSYHSLCLRIFTSTRRRLITVVFHR